MKKIILIAVCVIVNLYLFSNDGIYLTKGSILYPVNETLISMEKEILSFTVRDKKAVVNIYFEFLNPDSTNKNLTIGFQAPASYDWRVERGQKRAQIQNFTILYEDKLHPYKITSANCENCELKFKSEEDFLNTYNGIFVYLFELTFKPGINKVYHSYEFPASNSVLNDQIYNYILKTGAKWSGSTIKDFTINIDMGSNQYFYVKDVFEENATWDIIGTGRVSKSNSDRRIRILSGILQIKSNNFEPQENIEFGTKWDNSFMGLYTDKTVPEKIKSTLFILAHNQEQFRRYFDINTYTEEELRILRNTVYAQYGYKFNDEELLKYFNQFDWYFPDPNLDIDKITLTQTEAEFIKMIQKRESELKKSE